MSHRVSAFTFALCCAAGLAARPAAACGSRQLGWFSIAELLPRQGATEVAVDAPLVFDLNEFTGQQLAIEKADIPQGQTGLGIYHVKLAVTDATTGLPIAGHDVTGALGWGLPLISWHPNAPWTPGAQVKVSARIENIYARPTHGQGETEASAIFTVGNKPLPPLSGSSTVPVTLERYTAPMLVHSLCGDGESMDGVEPAVRSRLKLPAVTGGFSDAPYRVRTMVTRDVAYDFTVPWYQPLTYDDRSLNAGESPEILIRLPDDPTLAIVCHASEYEDASGKKLRTTPVCLPALRAVAPEPATGCNVGENNDSAAPLAVVIGWASFISYLILRRARRRRDF